MRRNLIVVLTLLLTASHASAQRRRAVGRGTAPPQVVIANDFRDAPSFPSWFSGFADYSSLTRDMDLQAGLRPLPPELGVSGTGFFISGNNRSDDLFMFLARVVRSQEGIRPNQRYQVA